MLQALADSASMPGGPVPEGAGVRPGSPLFAGLQRRALALALLGVFPPLLVAGVVGAYWRRHELLDARASATELVEHAVALHAREVMHAGQVLAALAPTMATDHLRGDSGTAVLAAALGSDPSPHNIILASAEGRVLAAGRPWDEDRALPADLLAAALATAGTPSRLHQASRGRSGPAILVAYGVTRGPPAESRVLVHAIGFDWLEDFQQARLPEGSVMSIFEADGRLVARAPAGSADGAAPQIPRMLAALSGPLPPFEAAGPDGALRTYAVGALGDGAQGGLLLSVDFPAAAVTAPADQILLAGLVGIALTAVGALVLATAAGNRLGRHLDRVAGAANRLAGWSDAAADGGAPVAPADVGTLALSLDRAARELQARQQVASSRMHWLLAQEQRLRSLLENSTEGIVLHDEGGRLLYSSPSTAAILGYDPDALLGRQVQQFVHPDDRPHLEAVVGSVKSASGGAACTSFRIRNGAGEWRWVACELRNLLDEPGVRGILSSYRDVTEYHRTQEALRDARRDLELRVRQRTFALVKANEALRSEIGERSRAEDALRRLSRVVEQTADSVLVTDRDGVIEYVNPAFEALTGYTRDEALGRTPRLFKSGRQDARFYERLWSTILGGQVFRSVVTNKAKDGHLFDEDQTITPLRNAEGEITHFVSTGRDITERKRTEQAVRRLNRMLEGETARIASLLHDEAGQFLTTAHIKLADIARDLPAGLHERVADVRQCLDQVEEQLRTISHDLHPRILTDLGFMESVRFRAEAFQRRTGIRTEVHGGSRHALSPEVEATLYRLVQEALTNAGKYSRASSVRIRVSHDSGRVTCTVSDDGVGFEMYEGRPWTGEPSLGLEGMRSRVEALGGRFSITSVPGRGTEVQACVPVEVSVCP